MSVSIIIPAINEARSLGLMLPGLLSMQGVAEVIVVDGGSRDDTPMTADKSGATVIHSEPGRARQMNAGAAIARAEYLLFLHADTQLPEDGVVQIDEALSQGAIWGRFDLRLTGKHWSLRIVERMINWRSCLSGISTGDQGIFLKRNLFEAVGGYAEIPLMEDVELTKRLKRIARPYCIHQPLTTSSRRWEHYGILRTILLMWQMRLAYYLGVDPETLARRYRRSDTPGQGS